MKNSLTKYTVYYGLIYVGITILFAIIASFISSAGSSATVLVPFISAMVVGQIFVKSEKRAPNNQERNKLTGLSFAVFIVINAGLLFLASAVGVFGGAGVEMSSTILGILAVVFIGLGLVVFFMMRWAYGGLARKYAVKLLGDQNSTFD